MGFRAEQPDLLGDVAQHLSLLLLLVFPSDMGADLSHDDAWLLDTRDGQGTLCSALHDGSAQHLRRDVGGPAGEALRLGIPNSSSVCDGRLYRRVVYSAV